MNGETNKDQWRFVWIWYFLGSIMFGMSSDWMQYISNRSIKRSSHLLDNTIPFPKLLPFIELATSTKQYKYRIPQLTFRVDTKCCDLIL